MPKISLRSLLFICCYFAICSMMFVIPNLWVGWLLVIATAIWMAGAMIQAFQTQDHFSLGFAVVGSTWLIIWLGFAIETPSTDNGPSHMRDRIVRIRAGIEWAVNLARTPLRASAPYIPGTVYRRDSPSWHDLYSSGQQPDFGVGIKRIGAHNSIRLAVCVTALLAGCLGGVVTWLYHARVLLQKQAGSSTPKSPEIERA